MPESMQKRGEQYLYMLHEYAISLCKWNSRFDIAKQLVQDLEARGKEDFMVYATYAEIVLTATGESAPQFDLDEMEHLIQKPHDLATPRFSAKLREINKLLEEAMLSQLGDKNGGRRQPGTRPTSNTY